MQAERARLEASKKRVAAALKAERRRLKRCPSVPSLYWRAACLVHWHSNPAEQAGLMLIRRHWPQRTVEPAAIVAALDASAVGTPAAEQRRQLDAPRGAAEEAAARMARTCLDELGLHTWVEMLNIEKGVAPMTSVALGRHALAGSAGDTAPALTTASTPKHKRQWLLRWRRRWRVLLGRVLPGERLGPGVAAAKAPANHCSLPARAPPKLRPRRPQRGRPEITTGKKCRPPGGRHFGPA